VAAETRIDHREDRYLRNPRLVARADGGADLHVIAWMGETEAHLAIGLDSEGRPTGEERVLDRRPAILGITRDANNPRVTEDASEDDRASDGGWVVSVERGAEGTSRIVVDTPEGRRVRVWEAHGIAAAPAIARAGLPVAGAEAPGAWIAFHHDVREDSGEPDVVKWIAVRFVARDGTVFEPAAPMVDRDRDREGEEQGFELPTLVVGQDGALAIFGRGSHRFWRQDLGAAGFGPRVAVGGDQGWGCRGRRIAACMVAGGSRVLTARREKSGIVIAPQTPPRGGPPALVPAAIEHTPRPRRDAPRGPARALDPARRWGRQTLFGDIHQHSAHSDGCGVADEPYLRARWGYGDDFAALTDHESFLGKRIGPGEWAYLQAIAERHNEPGRFATLVAYEWTGRRHPGPGHKVVYLPDRGHAIVSRDDVPSGKALVEAVKARGGFAVPHHVGWTGADEEAHDPVGQPVWEICSCHGCYLHAEHPLGARGDLRDQMVEEVLRRGHRFGFIACSDGHGLLWHHGVARKRDPFRTGLTAVQATECTREAILAAIRERRCYATSGVPIFLDVVAGAGHPMGSEIVSGEPVLLVAEAIGTAPIREIAIVGPQGPIVSASGRGERARVQARVERGWAYAKVVQEDGEMAWSSPIFVDRTD
jgi:hypothetical protein